MCSNSDSSSDDELQTATGKMSNDIEEVIDDMTAVNPQQGIKKGMQNLFITNSTIANPVFADYAIDKVANPIAGRYGHSSVFIGDYMYVFGGFVDDGTGVKICTNDFYRLHVATNVWLEIDAAVNVPSPRAYFAMSQIGNLIYVHGGVSFTSSVVQIVVGNSATRVSESQKTFYADTYVFDVYSDKWSKLSFTNSTVIPRAYMSEFVYGNFFCVMNGLTCSAISQTTSGSTATPTLTKTASIMFFNTTLATPTWNQVSTSNEAVWAHNSIVVGNSLYRFFGANIYPLSSTDANSTIVVYFNLAISGSNLVISSETKLVPQTVQPQSSMFFSLYNSGGTIRLFNGINYSLTANGGPCYYYFLIWLGLFRKYLLPVNESFSFTADLVNKKQVWVSQSTNYLTNPTIECSVGFYGSDFYVYGGRDVQYALKTALTKISGSTQTVIPTSLPVRISAGTNKFSVNGYDFTAMNLNGKVYICIHTVSGKNLSIYSLRVTSV